MKSNKNLDIVWHSHAARVDALSPDWYEEKANGDSVYATHLDEESTDYNGSFRLQTDFRERGSQLIVDDSLAYEAGGATILSPHAYRATPYHKRLKIHNQEALRIALHIGDTIDSHKKKETSQAFIHGTYFDFNAPRKLSVVKRKKMYADTVDQLSEHADTYTFFMQEAAHSVHEIIALSHLFEKKGMPFRVSLQGIKYPTIDGLYIKDPDYGRLHHREVIERLEDATWWYIEGYGANCGNDRSGYLELAKQLQATPYANKRTMAYRNEAKHATPFVDSTNAWGERESYDTIPHELTHARFADCLLDAHPYLEIIGLCCGNTPAINEKFVSQLRQHSYT